MTSSSHKTLSQASLPWPRVISQPSTAISGNQKIRCGIAMMLGNPRFANIITMLGAIPPMAKDVTSQAPGWSRKASGTKLTGTNTTVTQH